MSPSGILVLVAEESNWPGQLMGGAKSGGTLQKPQEVGRKGKSRGERGELEQRKNGRQEDQF